MAVFFYAVNFTQRRNTKYFHTEYYKLRGSASLQATVSRKGAKMQSLK